MKDFFLRVKKSVTIPIIGVTALFAVNLFAAEKLYLLGAVLLGYFTAALFIFMQASRIKMCEKSKNAVKLKTFWGVLLRLAFIFVAFAVAVKISVHIFALMISGFLTFYVVFYVAAIFENLRK